MKQKPCFSAGKFKVYPSIEPGGRVYYTVVNAASQAHRHHNSKTAAICIAKACHSLRTPASFSRAMVRDVVYLMSGGTKDG